MKNFKRADLAGQLLIAAGGLLYLGLSNQFEYFIYLYYSLGAWQLCSFLIHLLNADSWVARKSRGQYGKTLAWIIGALLISALLLLFQLPLLLLLMAILLFISPVLAVWYFFIGVEELRSIKRKELIHLK